MWSPFVLVAQAYLCLVSQVFFVGSLECQSTMVVSLAPRPIDRGDVSGITGKHRSREVPKLVLLEERAMRLPLLLNSILKQLCNICQIHKKSNM